MFVLFLQQTINLSVNISRNFEIEKTQCFWRYFTLDLYIKYPLTSFTLFKLVYFQILAQIFEPEETYRSQI